jgi:hypothetical protein
MAPAHRRCRRLVTGLLAVCLISLAAACTTAAAAPIPSSELGVAMSNSQPSSLQLATSAGVGVVRQDFTDGTNADSAIAAFAALHLRAYPILELSGPQSAALDATEMATYATSFALRYGVNGSFWSANPQLPYLPVTSFEIGNEPNATPDPTLPPNWSQTLGPAGYALVYEAARTAIHLVDPTGTVVVAGMLDSGGTPFSTVEQYLSQIGPMDAVGFHPYQYYLSSMESDTSSLRTWLNANGHAGVPIDVNEFDSMDAISGSISSWGQTTATYTQWALCTPSLDVQNVQPFWWGSTSQAGQPSDPWYSLTDAGGNLTPLGSDYLAEVTQLTTQGCPAPPTPPASTPSKPAKPKKATAAKAKANRRRSTHSAAADRSARRSRRAH